MTTPEGRTIFPNLLILKRKKALTDAGRRVTLDHWAARQELTTMPVLHGMNLLSEEDIELTRVQECALAKLERRIQEVAYQNELAEGEKAVAKL